MSVSRHARSGPRLIQLLGRAGRDRFVLERCCRDAVRLHFEHKPRHRECFRHRIRHAHRHDSDPGALGGAVPAGGSIVYLLSAGTDLNDTGRVQVLDTGTSSVIDAGSVSASVSVDPVLPRLCLVNNDSDTPRPQVTV